MSEIKRPLLSILIATKNRQKYAQLAVESILSVIDSRIEVIVQDNSDSMGLEQSLASYKSDTRLKYRYTPPPFSSIDNFNAAIELSSGEYVCLIGDDDGINPEIIEATQWAKDNGVDSLVGKLSADYRWGGTGIKDQLLNKITGETLAIRDFTGKIHQPDIQESLRKIALNGCTYYLDFDMPKLYHGIVRRDCLEAIRKKTGFYIRGLSPDIYTAIALACVVKKIVLIDYPLTIPGVCAESTSATEGAIKKHSRRLEDAPHFRDRGEYHWSKEVPRIYSVETIWADSAFAALRNMGRNDLIHTYSRFMLYAHILNKNKSAAHMVWDHMVTYRKGNVFQAIVDTPKLLLSFLNGPLIQFAKRLLKGMAVILGFRKMTVNHNITNIGEAMVALNSHIKKQNLSFAKCASRYNVK